MFIQDIWGNTAFKGYHIFINNLYCANKQILRNISHWTGMVSCFSFPKGLPNGQKAAEADCYAPSMLVIPDKTHSTQQ